MLEVRLEIQKGPLTISSLEVLLRFFCTPRQEPSCCFATYVDLREDESSSSITTMRVFRLAAATFAATNTLVMAQNLDDVSMCIIQCDAPISGCSMGGGDSSGCVCREDEARPNAAAAACLRDCAEEGGLDPRTLFRDSCDAIFEDKGDNDNDADESSAVEETWASRTQDSASTRTEESSSDGMEGPDDENDATRYGKSVLMAGGGMIAALLA